MAKKLSVTILTVAVIAVLTGRVWPQESQDKIKQPSIRVTGEATLAVKPDQAQIDIGVVTQASTAQTAASENAQSLDAVLAELRRALTSGADIRTSGYSLNPNYRYPKDGGTPTITGYTASNTIQLKINDLSLVGKAIDTATGSGANKIQRLAFTLKDERAAQAEALKEASVKAREKAEAVAAALRVKIGRILFVEEGGIAVRPRVLQESAAMRAGALAAPTPVEAGNIDVHATVTLTVEIAP